MLKANLTRDGTENTTKHVLEVWESLQSLPVSDKRKSPNRCSDNCGLTRDTGEITKSHQFQIRTYSCFRFKVVVFITSFPLFFSRKFYAK